MIDDERQDLAAAYVLNALDGYAAGAFEAELASDPELRAFTDELREAAASLAHTAPRRLPPPELRERVLSTIRAEAPAVSIPPPAATPMSSPTPTRSGFNLLPWALAAGFAVTSAALWFERDQLRNDSTALRGEAIELRNRDAISKARITDLSKEVAALQGRDALAQVRIASLTAQVDEFRKGTAVIVWDPVNQRGIVRLANLPRPENGKDYQLWVIDPKYPAPVSGGIVPMDPDGSARVSFTTAQPIDKADKFAISVEPAGGVPKATGPIVLLGN